MMKPQLPLLAALCAGALLLSGGALAQDSSSGSATHSAVYQTPQGELTVNSMPAKAQSYGQVPSFEQLAQGGKSISADQADAYPPLANDFEHADKNRDNHISQSEYESWLKQG
ncbi:MAG TPA: hypothetical protein VN614_02765 [Rhodanobacter sp.]|jgi:hypothetical protein|nr:hypothetical protein [Rhodanobacter sp.]